jgi:AcrR family transcriptional regulator
MNTPPRHQTRDDLLVAATRLIRTSDAARDVTVRKIVEDAHANLNAVNYHFGSKENLVREAVRVIIGDHFRERGMAPGSTGPDLLANLVRICDFLFEEPVAAELALRSELDVDGAGETLTSETMTALADMVRHACPALADEDVRFRVLVVTAVVHQLFLRPRGSSEWLGADPGDKAARDAMLARLCALAGLAPETQSNPRGRKT